MIIWIFINIFSIKNGYIHAGPMSSRPKSGSAYLPPLVVSTPDHTNFIQSSFIVDANQNLRKTNSYTTSYKTNHNTQKDLESSPQLKSESSYSRTYHDSYAPQPSGIGMNTFSSPTFVPLPPLIPSTVLTQLKSTTSTTFPPSINNSIAVSTLSNYQENNLMAPSSIIMVDRSMEMLTHWQNQTIIAAKLLASSLLQDTGDSSSTKLDGFNKLELSEVKILNPNDMYIVKAQKNAYIVPNNFNTMEIQELYSMRNNLHKAFTINQFIFILKPEHINFLNKLV